MQGKRVLSGVALVCLLSLVAGVGGLSAQPAGRAQGPQPEASWARRSPTRAA